MTFLMESEQCRSEKIGKYQSYSQSKSRLYLPTISNYPDTTRCKSIPCSIPFVHSFPGSISSPSHFTHHHKSTATYNPPVYNPPVYYPPQQTYVPPQFTTTVYYICLHSNRSRPYLPCLMSLTWIEIPTSPPLAMRRRSYFEAAVIGVYVTNKRRACRARDQLRDTSCTSFQIAWT